MIKCCWQVIWVSGNFPENGTTKNKLNKASTYDACKIKKRFINNAIPNHPSKLEKTSTSFWHNYHHWRTICRRVHCLNAVQRIKLCGHLYFISFCQYTVSIHFWNKVESISLLKPYSSLLYSNLESEANNKLHFIFKIQYYFIVLFLFPS